MRPVLALVAGAVAAALGAVILGEYPLSGVIGVIAGALFGLAVGEIVLSAGGEAWRSREELAMAGVAVLTFGGVVWAAWISAGHLWRYVAKGAWAGAVVGAALGPVWLRSGVRRLAHRRDDTADADS